MASIRDLVGAIRQREGVDAAVVLGRDGLLIDSQSVPGWTQKISRRAIPAIIGAADELGAHGARGRAHDRRPRVRARHRHRLRAQRRRHPLRPRASDANVGQLLFELRRNREHIAALV